MAYVLFLLVCAIWGSSFILMKKAGLVFGPVTVGAWRVAGGAAALALVWWWQGARRPVPRSDLLRIVVVSLVGYVWPYSVQPYLVARHGSGFIAMTVSFVPLLTILVGVPMLGVWPSRRQAIGVVGGLVCMAMLMADGLARNVPLVDLAMALSVPFNYSIINTYIRLTLRELPALELTLVMLTVGSLVMLPLSVVLPTEHMNSEGNVVLAIVCLALLGVFGTGIAIAMFNKLVQEQGPLFAGMVTYLIPVGALAWGWFDHEHVTPLQVTALSGIFVMVAIVQYKAALRLPEEVGEVP